MGKLTQLVEDTLNEAKKDIPVATDKDIKMLKKKAKEGKITYRGVTGKKGNELYDLFDDNASELTVDGKDKYYVSNTTFRDLGGPSIIKFSAPTRKS